MVRKVRFALAQYAPALVSAGEMPAYLLSTLLLDVAAESPPPPVPPPAQVQTIDCCVFEPLVEPGSVEWGASSVITGVAAASSDEPVAEAEGAAPAVVEEAYDPGVFWRQTESVKWRFGGATAAIAATGFANWDWGSSRFRFNSEGWFGEDTASLGMDKLGHAYSSYVLTEFFTDGIDVGAPRHRSYTAAILAMGLMTGIEVFDGFSKEHGFSHEDLAVDAAGVLFSVARRSVPGLREKLDFRLLYTPSRSSWRALSCFPKPHCDRDGVAARSPITDYVNQRYLLALKLSGFEQMRHTPLRLVELHGGYYARGFTKEEEDRGDPLRRRFFFGVGVNLGELLFPGRPRGVGRAAKSVLEYLQLPYTAVHTN